MTAEATERNIPRSLAMFSAPSEFRVWGFDVRV
jgi:hypothetical protein